MSLPDEPCIALLKWACPRMGLRWEGFRRVRGQVCKRIGRRMQALGLTSVEAYRERLERGRSIEASSPFAKGAVKRRTSTCSA